MQPEPERSRLSDVPGGVGFSREVIRMNWAQIEGKWDQVKGKAQKQWGKLTDDDFAIAKGNRDEFVGRVKERYGVAREEAEKQVDAFLKHYS
jgi:uncharacterized protein YjbJ (UPF0337 family)